MVRLTRTAWTIGLVLILLAGKAERLQAQESAPVAPVEEMEIGVVPVAPDDEPPPADPSPSEEQTPADPVAAEEPAPADSNSAEEQTGVNAAAVAPAAGVGAPIELNTGHDDQEESSLAAAESMPGALQPWELLSPSYGAASLLPDSGRSMYYNPGVMRTVIDSRLKFGHIQPCAECIGSVAMLRYGDLDRKVWLQTGPWHVEGPYHVVDAAATKHVGLLLERDWIVDVDYQTARRWNFVMPYVTIWDHPPLDLLLAGETIPLSWRASLLPAPAFAPSPHSVTLPDSRLAYTQLQLKWAVDKRQLSTESFVDLIGSRPEARYIK